MAGEQLPDNMVQLLNNGASIARDVKVAMEEGSQNSLSGSGSCLEEFLTSKGTSAESRRCRIVMIKRPDDDLPPASLPKGNTSAESWHCWITGIIRPDDDLLQVSPNGATQASNFPLAIAAELLGHDLKGGGAPKGKGASKGKTMLAKQELMQVLRSKGVKKPEQRVEGLMSLAQGPQIIDKWFGLHQREPWAAWQTLKTEATEQFLTVRLITAEELKAFQTQGKGTTKNKEKATAPPTLMAEDWNVKILDELKEPGVALVASSAIKEVLPVLCQTLALLPACEGRLRVGVRPGGAHGQGAWHGAHQSRWEDLSEQGKDVPDLRRLGFSRTPD